MKGTDAILHYYLKILKNFYNLATNMHEPYRVLFYLGREQKRDKEVEKRKDLYIRWPVENDGDSIPFEEIRNAWRNRNHEFH